MANAAYARFKFFISSAPIQKKKGAEQGFKLYKDVLQKGEETLAIDYKQIPWKLRGLKISYSGQENL